MEEGKDQQSIQSSTRHLTRDTKWESDKNTRKHHSQESQEVSSFPAGDCKEQTRQYNKDKHETQITKQGPQKMQRLGTVSKNNTGGFKHVKRYQSHPLF